VFMGTSIYRLGGVQQEVLGFGLGKVGWAAFY